MGISAEAELFDYGIQTEHSDVRAHVSVVNRTIYAFPTANGLAAINRFKPVTAEASQPGFSGITARGYLVKMEQIEDLRRLRCPNWDGWQQFPRMRESLSTSARGALAVECVLYALRKGRFPFWLNASEDDRENVQIKGVDVLIFCRKRIQIKCDWSCGDKPNGTGNLFLQFAERNPLRLH